MHTYVSFTRECVTRIRVLQYYYCRYVFAKCVYGYLRASRDIACPAAIFSNYTDTSGRSVELNYHRAPGERRVAPTARRGGWRSSVSHGTRTRGYLRRRPRRIPFRSSSDLSVSVRRACTPERSAIFKSTVRPG